MADDVKEPDRTLYPPTAASEKGVLELKVGDIIHETFRIEKNPSEGAKTAYIGKGAAGVVYRATNIELERPVALKFLISGMNASDEERNQGKAEARTIANLKGRNTKIVQMHSLSEWNGHTVMEMEWLDGGSAKDRMENPPAEPSSTDLLKVITQSFKKETEREPAVKTLGHKGIEYFVRTSIQVAEQLEILNEKGILHRDIKPGNIMYRDKEQTEAVLVDYGLVTHIKSTDAEAAGTLEYMSPEQTKGTDDLIDARADVFGLGATLYHMLTGKRVYDFKNAENAMQKIAIILNKDKTPINIRFLNKKVDRNLAAIVHKAVEKEPGQRYDSAREFYEDLKRWMEGKSVKARPLTSFVIPTPRRLKKRGLYWLSAAAVSCALVGLTTSLYKAKEPERLRNARVENYIAEMKSSMASADSMRKEADKSYEMLIKKSLIVMSHDNVEIATLINHQKIIGSVFDNYSKALKLAEEWKKDDVSPDKKSEEKRRELDVLVREFERKNDDAVKKVSAYEKILEAKESYKEKDFANAEKALALALDRLYEGDTQKEWERVKEEYNMYQKQRTVQGFLDIDARVQAYRDVCRACFMDNIKEFSGSEDDITPEKGKEWKKMKTSIENILKTPDYAILRKIPLDQKTHQDLIGYAEKVARKAFENEKSILEDPDAKHAVDMKRNRVAQDKYIAELTEKYKLGKMDDEEYRVLMQLPLPSDRERFKEALDKEFKKGTIQKTLYDKLRSEK